MNSGLQPKILLWLFFFYMKVQNEIKNKICAGHNIDAFD